MSPAEALLRTLLERIAGEHGYRDCRMQVHSTTSEGANYTSALFLVTLAADGKEELHLFAKVSIVGDTMRMLMNATKMFAVEGFFYNELIKTYERIEDDRGVPDAHRLAVPKFYGCNPSLREETVVLENLTARGFAGHDRFKSLDWDHASSAVEVLAKFHALSFAFQKTSPEEFRRVTADLWFVRPNSDKEVKDSYFPEMIARGLAVLDEERKARVAKLMEAGGVNMYERFNQPFGVPAIIHGDYRPSNLLFKQEGDKVVTMPVDFQTVHTGCVASDLVYLIFVGTDSEFRAKHYAPLVELYYDQLTAALKRLEVDINEVYPRKEFDRELKEVLPYAVLLGISLLPIVLVEADNAPRVDGDSGVNSFVVTPNEMFAERFRGLVEDCVRLGAL